MVIIFDHKLCDKFVLDCFYKWFISYIWHVLYIPWLYHMMLNLNSLLIEWLTYDNCELMFMCMVIFLSKVLDLQLWEMIFLKLWGVLSRFVWGFYGDLAFLSKVLTLICANYLKIYHPQSPYLTTIIVSIPYLPSVNV